LKHIAHPIIGDAKHGKSVHNHFFTQHFDNQRLLLSCTQLELKHPVSNEVLRIKAKPEESFMKITRKLGWTDKIINL
jgi:tRNA pseudouridine65 synthase